MGDVIDTADDGWDDRPRPLYRCSDGKARTMTEAVAFEEAERERKGLPPEPPLPPMKLPPIDRDPLR